jgi:hypothetical protein
MRRNVLRCRNQVHGLLCRHGVAYKRSEMNGSALGELVNDAALASPARLEAIS